ncbi:stalk domain-containing protein [Paenibacillus sp. L3-i20]|uniref:stalk domain-containing protein n=1 Tax=Paenibacillus sp. L3-i20 TaxID=2905833 RepID=UPI001EDFCBDC|nr:stalk domain-containing protein [Paenibacillus sp. L3-i20]GKU80405.1 hypothetical protein L3i20_v248020 [Paenibacillus sp. L3-i20]
MNGQFGKKFTLFTATLMTGVLLTVSSASAVPGDLRRTPLLDTSAVVNSSYDVVVLGDSISAGYELGFTEKSIPYGYAEHVYEQALFQGFRAQYNNYGVLGLTSNGLNKWLSAAALGENVSKDSVQSNLKDPRADEFFAKTDLLENHIREAELILISIGGNDFLQYMDKLDPKTDVTTLPESAQSELKSGLSSIISNYETELSASLENIHKLAPNAKVIISNQYLPVPFLKIKGVTTYLIPEATALLLKDGQTQLLKRLKSVITQYSAKKMDIKMADSASVVDTNILTYTNIDKGDPHPTAAGYAVMGKAYTEQLWGDYKTVKPRKSGVPISVVVNGEEVITKYSPVIKKGRTFIAIADITDAIGAKRSWDGPTNTATIQLGERTVEITIGAKTIKIDGKTVPLNADPAYLQQFPGEKKTYVPLAALSEGLGLHVTYRDTLKTAFINN